MTTTARPLHDEQLPDRTLSVAPMMEWTDTHCRAFHRVLAPGAWLYSEMVTEAAIRHGKRDRLLAFDASEHPVALQLGGSDPAGLAEAARIGAGYGYDEINLNCGCPSERVQAGRFGACLMNEPQLVAECVAAMRAAVDVPVTVKTRIGVDGSEGFAFVSRFVETVAAAGCGLFVIHARKAWLKGLSPKENREVPPLDYPMVHRLKQAFPHLAIIINGGVASLDEVAAQLGHVDGVMIGREAYQSPWFLAELTRASGSEAPVSRAAAVEAYRPYMARQLEHGVPLRAMTRHMLGLFNGQPGGRAWRRCLSEQAGRPGAGLDVLDEALAMLRTDRLAKAA